MALAITILFIIIATVLGAFIRRRTRDNCLKDFWHNTVTLQEATGKTVQGKLRVESTGLEFLFSSVHSGNSGHNKASYILYKNEYSRIIALIRFHNELSPANKKQRDKQLRKTYHPTMLRRLRRKTLNVFKTIRDSVMEVVNLLITHAKKTTPAAGVLTSQDKYISQMKKELVTSVGTSFEPLLERYIGRIVILEMLKGDKLVEYSGVLKDYTAEFIEIMDVDYDLASEAAPGKADIIIPRKIAVVRHHGEKI